MVLSGGGATGISHIGVLKALEENQIPIDFICGTSMGAVIAAAYASGYSPYEIEALMTSQEFLEVTTGKIPEDYVYYYKQEEDNASLISLKFNLDSFFQTSIPTNFISPTALDFQLMENFMGPAAAAQYDFDSLFIPFRCVASDIVAKQPVVFRDGPLAQAIRASMTYPFYLRPIKINDKLLFDGGLYNNFPTDVMYDDFFPDIIIGSNVSDPLNPPEAENVISQVKNMLLRRDSFDLRCENGILIEPKADIGTFDFASAAQGIPNGYNATLAKMDEIKSSITRRASNQDLAERRKAFRGTIPQLTIDQVEIEGLSKASEYYVKRILNKRKGVSLLSELKPKYFRMFSDDKIKFIFPRPQFNEATQHFDLKIEVEKERDLTADFGGVFSSRPINTGYIGLKYHFLRKAAFTAEANSYFGKFYGSVLVKGRFDLPTRFQFYLEPIFTLNRWDYFRSFTTFFEDVRPSFLIKNEAFGGLNLGLPVKNKGRVKTDFKLINLTNEYYQTEQFLSVDTADITSFRGQTAGLTYERSTLNRKQYASSGTFLMASARLIDGSEETVFGSTKPESQALTQITIFHNWVKLSFEYQNYFKKKGIFKFGFNTQWVHTNQPFFSNYTATILSAPSFQPLPESRTLFQQQFRAFTFGTFGLQTIVTPKKNFDFRFEGYVFQPYQRILEDEAGVAYLGPELEERFYIGSAAAIFHSPLGPVSFSANYYDFNQDSPWSFIFNFGFVIHNKEALK